MFSNATARAISATLTSISPYNTTLNTGKMTTSSEIFDLPTYNELSSERSNLSSKTTQRALETKSTELNGVLTRITFPHSSITTVLYANTTNDNTTAMDTIGTTSIGTSDTVPTAEFGAILAFSLVISILAIIGNSLVIYASVTNKNSGPFRFIDGIIRSLAVADLLLGLIGNPFIVISYYLGKYKMHFDLRLLC